MNQRLQNVEIKGISEQYAENKLYQAVSSIGHQLESELTEFGLCPEECFMEVFELLTAIAEKGEDFLFEVADHWVRKSNEYRRFDRHVSDDEISKAVGIVFGFAILATDSSRHPFYRRTLSEQLALVVANHPFNGWQLTLERIFSVPLPDGWFDAFIDEEPQDGDELALPKDLDTKRARLCFSRAIKKKYMEKTDNGKYRWLGTNDKGNRSELAYFCGKIYGYVHTISGNAGENFPEESLNKLFGVTRLYSSLSQVYNAQRPQNWRNLIDEICE